ncbi:SRPBCC family protein [Arenibacterium halophilum]|uniref:Zinc-binding dehydrogenase n=1 Tax=Arenibacterium halophilum TaxID=2583821 RepID=A0ABY2X2N4_9RHOB|nr:SRPBCC family protein [Arenibacterium halophilum]TMV09265.1 zinc-binding dehydrogenase [Arenibacterium halophilum]
MARVRESAIIAAPVEEVWHWLRDFNSHAAWHPAIASSEIEGGVPADTVGAVRAFTLTDGGFLREQLLALDDDARELSYCLIEAPLPLHGYVATIRLLPVTDGGQTFWEWSSEFSPPPDRAAELTALVANDIYRAGMRALERHLRRDDPARIRVQRAPMPAPTPMPVAVASGQSARAVVMTAHGGPEVLEIREITAPDPGPGEVRIAQSHIGVNFIDIYCRTGYFDLLTPPGVPGMEAAGVVDSIGAGVAHLSPGDRVAYACAPTGAYASSRTMAADLVVRIPDWLDSAHAAAGLLKGITAGFLLHDVHRLQRGENVVVHAAAGGVGTLLTQWAGALGAEVIATVSDEAKAQVASANGARAVAIGRGAEFLDTVQRLTDGRGADVVFDAIGRDSFANSIAALATRGHLVSFGQASGDIGAREIGPLSSKSLTLSRPNYGHYIADRAMMTMQADRLFAAIEAGRVTIPDPVLTPLEQVAQVHDDLEHGRTTGAIVLTA